MPENDDPTVRSPPLEKPRRGRDADARDCRNLALITDSFARKLDELEHADEAVGMRRIALELRRIAGRLEPPPDTSDVPDE